ncbi:MAG TPA: acetate/propionate family kinase [Candidatus Angelobacter sp.]
MEHLVLCLNSGSSSLKFALFRISGTVEQKLVSGAVENIGAQARLWLRDADKVLLDQQQSLPGAHECIAAIFNSLDHLSLSRPQAAGHRIVHGGPRYTQPERIDSRLLEELERLIPLAPLHLPAQIELIRALAQHYPDLLQVACFDTAFHAGMPEVAGRLPLPRRLWDVGIRHYGFHGLSYEFIVNALEAAARGRVIIAHLGNGASIVALRDGKPVDTSMGLTPAGGFMMSTRSGDLDPGILLYLLRNGYSSDQVEKMVNRESGLLGVSGSSSDMKTLLTRRSQDPMADQAIQMFCYGIRKFIGAYAAVLGGVDTLVFTGGIGERAAAVREEICRGLEFLGIQLSGEQNAQNAAIISAPGSQCSVRVIPTDEDLMIARHTAKTISEL